MIVFIELYEEMMYGLEDLKQQLIEYGEGEIFVDDFWYVDIWIFNFINYFSNQIIGIFNFIEKSYNENNGVMMGEIRVLWIIFQNGIVRKEEEREDILVFIRIYMILLGVNNIILEVLKFRYRFVIL